MLDRYQIQLADEWNENRPREINQVNRCTISVLVRYICCYDCEKSEMILSRLKKIYSKPPEANDFHS